jgi:hypothetical protein
VLYQCFAPDEAKYGLRVLQIAPESHDAAFFQYFWALPFLELLVHLHSNPKHFNHKCVVAMRRDTRRLLLTSSLSWLLDT